MEQEVIAKNKSDWWNLARQEVRKWNSEHHEDDQVSIGGWIGEQYPGKVFGWIPFRDQYWDWDVSLSGFPDDEDEDEDEDEDY